LNLPPGELAHATDLIDLVRDVGDFSVGVAVHPEGHPASSDRVSDRRRQADKLALADFEKSGFDLRELMISTTKTRAFTHRQPQEGEGSK
jgi:hypothetical protein